MQSLFQRRSGYRVRQVGALLPLSHDQVTEAIVRRLATSELETCDLRDIRDDATEPISCAFNTRDSRLRLVAVGDEAGHLNLFNASVECSSMSSKGTCSSAFRPQHTWKAHHNTVFSVSWIDNDRKLVTGSGDMTGIVWDLEKFRPLCTLAGHRGSIKSISAKHDMPSVLISSSRDGSIKFWDVRAHTLRDGRALRPIGDIIGAHPSSFDASFPPKTTRSGQQFDSTEPQMSTTSALFLLDDKYAVSSGASDGLIKFWDTRKNLGGRPDPIRVLSTPARRGISSLSLSRCGSRLLASRMDHTICIHDSSPNPETSDRPLSCFAGHRSSFYVRSVFSGNDDYVLSSSASNVVYVWKVGAPRGALPLKLTGHEAEVNGVDWCPFEAGLVASCSDDMTVRLWRPPAFNSLTESSRINAFNVPDGIPTSKLTPVRRRRNHMATVVVMTSMPHRRKRSHDQRKITDFYSRSMTPSGQQKFRPTNRSVDSSSNVSQRQLWPEINTFS